MLTKDQLAELRKPFRDDQIKWKVQTQPKDPKTGAKKLEGWGVAVSYLDSRDVAERLDLAVCGDWHDDYNLFGAALECSLTVCGVTRKDVGEAKSPKELYSDAFKRSAVKFGVGAFLYRMPTLMAKMARKDEYKPWQFTDGAKASLRAISTAVAKGDAPAARYADLMLLGEYQAPEQMGSEDTAEPAAAPQNRPSTPRQAAPRPIPQAAQPEAPKAAQNPDDPIGSVRAQNLHKILGVLLNGTDYEGRHDVFCGEAVSHEVPHLQDLTNEEAKQVAAYIKEFEAERASTAA